jgi:hypothetical protein
MSFGKKKKTADNQENNDAKEMFEKLHIPSCYIITLLPKTEKRSAYKTGVFKKPRKEVSNRNTFRKTKYTFH